MRLFPMFILYSSLLLCPCSKSPKIQKYIPELLYVQFATDSRHFYATDVPVCIVKTLDVIVHMTAPRFFV